MCNHTFTEHKARAEGRIRLHQRFASHYLSTPRDLIVYLPPGYGAPQTRYPVLYLQDGQNLFDPSTAFMGQEWRADITADHMILTGAIEPLIIVGIYNTGSRRVSEYTPTRHPQWKKGGKADRYAQMLARDLKPFIESEYAAKKAAVHTGVGGSSLGGLVSLEAGLLYPRVFGKLAVMSPSVWWDQRVILGMVAAYKETVRPKIWLDAGTEEGDRPQSVIDDLRRLRAALEEKGWREGDDLAYIEAQGAGHNEHAWAARFGQMLRYLFPPQVAAPSHNGNGPAAY